MKKVEQSAQHRENKPQQMCFLPLWPVKCESPLVAAELEALLEMQTITNQQLMFNLMLTAKFLEQSCANIRTTKSTSCSTQISHSHQLFRTTIPQVITPIAATKNSAAKPARKAIKSGSDYEPSVEEQENNRVQVAETKNIPKTFSNLIIQFCRRRRSYVQSVLQAFSVDEQQFHSFLNNQKLKTRNIVNLKALWIESESNCFAKVLRIISAEFLRKHCYSYIYNSHMEKKKRNSKYRSKMLQSIQSPHRFNRIKDF